MNRRAFLLALPQQPLFRARARLVVVPVQVTDRSGNPVPELQAADFVLRDNGFLTPFTLEDFNAPVSLILAVETAATSTAALDKLRKTAAIFQPLISGHDGLIGLLAYDDDIRTLAPIRQNSTLFDTRLKSLRPQGSAGKLHDAVMESVRLHQDQPSGRRRVLILIGESKDLGSKSRLDQAVTAAQAANVTVYPLTYSRTTSAFASREPVSGSSAPTMNILAALRELGRLGQANSAAELALHTGGMTASFTRQRGLESALQRIGADLHSQYSLTFEPKAALPGEYHQLQVSLRNRPEYSIRHRPGYWIDSESAGL